MAVGLSGGVDSSVAAWLLKQQGYQVLGVYMKNWPPPGESIEGECPYEQDVLYAEMVARRLGIEFKEVDLSAVYAREVVNYLFAEYAAGRTPNPDVVCNREIKFEAFWHVVQGLGAEYVATGHYCRRVERYVPAWGERRVYLYAGNDGAKDQSYFLCQVRQDQLANALFPIGHMHKKEVRRVAHELHLATATRRDSYGICFVGEVDMPQFLSQRIAFTRGEVVEIPQGDALDAWLASQSTDGIEGYALDTAPGHVIGEHEGAASYTVGQRKGLGIGGTQEPLYVLGIDTKRNRVYVGQGQRHPLLYRRGLRVEASQVHWLVPEEQLAKGESMRVECRLRYRQPLQWATLCVENDGYYTLLFDAPQRGVTPGQYAAWYRKGALLGSGPVDC